jgi:hypothetical protein
MVLPQLRRSHLIQLGFWLLVTLVFLIDRKYLLQKIELPHVVACLGVRVGLLFGLTALHTRVLWPRFYPSRRYLTYAAALVLSLDGYILLQSAYDWYLFGFVIGDEDRRGFWANLPYNLLSTLWYLVVTLLLHLVLRRTEAPVRVPAPSPSLPSDSSPDAIWLKTGTSRVKVSVADIRYAQGLKDYSLVYTAEGRLVVQGSLKTLEEALAGRVVRVHKSYVVPLDRVRRVGTDYIELGDVRIPVGRSYRKALLSRLEPPITS